MTMSECNLGLSSMKILLDNVYLTCRDESFVYKMSLTDYSMGTVDSNIGVTFRKPAMVSVGRVRHFLPEA